MLVLSRKAGESIRIGDDLVVTVTRVRGNRVQISIDAPREVAIRRGELSPLESPAQESPAPHSDRSNGTTRPMLLSVPLVQQAAVVTRSA